MAEEKKKDDFGKVFKDLTGMEMGDEKKAEEEKTEKEEPAKEESVEEEPPKEGSE